MMWQLKILDYKTLLNILTNNGIERLQAEAELNLLLESINFSKKDFLVGKELSKKQKDKVESIINERIKSKHPIQHLIGYSCFMGEKFIVNPNVLIPRPETELLVEEVVKLKGKDILDIGTGSGCIAIMLKKLTNKNIIASDISKEALDIAKQNDTLNKTNITFILSDLFNNIEDKFDIIVSNPPYIPHSEKLSEEVLKEPLNALFADNEGLAIYEKIIKESPNYLNKNGHLAFELGINQHNQIKKLLTENNFKNIKTVKDYSGIERIVIASL